MSDITRSPFDLVQEMAVAGEPKVWRLMVACALLNKTHGRQVRPMVERLWAEAPTPGSTLTALREGRLDDLLRPLGLVNRRKNLLGAMASDFLDGKPLEECRGAGAYCQQSVQIFVHGRTDVATDDPWLKKYLAWKRSRSTNLAEDHHEHGELPEAVGSDDRTGEEARRTGAI